MSRQTDEKRQEWHAHLTKHGKRPEDVAESLGGVTEIIEITKNSSKQEKPEEDWIKNTSQEEKQG